MFGQRKEKLLFAKVIRRDTDPLKNVPFFIYDFDDGFEGSFL